MVLYEITQMWTNGTVTQKIVATIDRLNICQIKPYKSKGDDL